MDNVTNEPKPDDQAADGPAMDAHLDAAIRELDRFRRPEAWAAATADVDRQEFAEAPPMAADLAEAVGGEPPADPAAEPEAAPEVEQIADAEAGAPPVEVEPPAEIEQPAGTSQAEMAPAASEPGDDLAFADDDDDLFGPEPVAAPPVGEVTDPVPDDVPEAVAGLSCGERQAFTASDFDNEMEEGEPQPQAIPAAGHRLPEARDLSSVPLAGNDSSWAAPATDSAPAEPVTLPRRMFGLKRALDAHRLGVSIDELPAEPVAQPAEEPSTLPEPAIEESAPPLEQLAVPKSDSDVREAEQIKTEADGARSSWFGGWRAPRPVPEPDPPLPESETSVDTSAATVEAPEIGAVEPPIPEPAVAREPDSKPEPALASMPERKGWFGARSTPEPGPPSDEPGGSGPAVVVGAAAAAAGAAVVAAEVERKGWFGSRKTIVKKVSEPVVAEATLTAAPLPEVAPPAAPERKGWFRRKKTDVSEVAEPDAAAEADAASAESDDPFAAVKAAVEPKAKGGRKGWFGSKPAPAPDKPDVEASPSSMVDLSPVREAMQAAALKRGEGLPDVASLISARGAGEAVAAQAAEAGRVGVLLVNLGTPDAPTARAVRRYLRQFLSDRRVIERDTFTWQLVLKGIILPFRPRSKARAYRAIWNKERNESPLKTVTRSQAEKLGETLARAGSDAVVDWAMRYGNPSMESRIKNLMAQGCQRILLVPLYPQYSSATTATVCDEAFRILTRLRNQPALRIAPPYYADAIYIEAVASSIEAGLAKLAFKPEVILASFHGMPLEYVQKGDPYQRQCMRTAELLRERLRMADATFLLTFQSRFGRAEWLQPYTDETLRKLAKDGVKSVAVVTPGFVSDCLETLEEIAIENAQIFRKKGGKNFAFIPCLNDSERGMTVIREIAARELNGWV